MLQVGNGDGAAKGTAYKHQIFSSTSWRQADRRPGNDQAQAQGDGNKGLTLTA